MKVTGWDNGLSQDYDKKLGQWFANRLGAREQLRRSFGMKTSELTGPALDWAVAKCKNADWSDEDIACMLVDFGDGDGAYKPSADWAQGDPILERAGIDIRKGNPLYFPQGNEKGDYYEPLWIAGKQHGPTPLIAAMRRYIASKLGDEVEVPDELV